MKAALGWWLTRTLMTLLLLLVTSSEYLMRSTSGCQTCPPTLGNRQSAQRPAEPSRAEMNRLAETWTRTPTTRGCGHRALLRISCAARTNLGPRCNKTVYIISETEPCIWEGRMGRWGRLKERYLIPESISSHRPSPLFSPRPVLNPVVSALKNTLRLVAVWCKSV